MRTRIRNQPTERPRIVLHAGISRTGSTSIQLFLRHHQSELLQRGIWYPAFGEYQDPTRLDKTGGHALFMKAAQNDDFSLRDRLLLGPISREKSGLEGIHTILLSSEAFFLQPSLTPLLEYLNPFPIELVFFVRRQDTWANSQYIEFTVGGSVWKVDCSASEWVHQKRAQVWMDFPRFVELNSTSLGSEAVRWCPYPEENKSASDLLRTFVELVRLPDLIELGPTLMGIANRYWLSGPAAQFLGAHAREIAGEVGEHLNHFLDATREEIKRWRLESRTELKGYPWVLEERVADSIMAKFRPNNEELFSRFPPIQSSQSTFPQRPIFTVGEMEPDELRIIMEMSRKFRKK